MKRYRCLVAALLLAVLARPSPAQEASASLGAELFAQSNATGMVLLVVRRDGSTFFKGYGETSPGSGMTPDQESVVRLCSLTKVFTADVLARMVAEGRVSLGDSLARWEPPWAGEELRTAKAATAPAKRGPRTRRAALQPSLAEREMVARITLEQLATHTSGLPREIGEGPRGSGHFTFPDQQQRWSWLFTAPVTGTPGERALYSNVAFDFLSDALAQAAGMPYAKLLHSQLLQPLGMRETTLYPTADECSRLMQGSRDQGPCTATEATEGSSGLYSTAHDVAKWLQYLLKQGPAGAQQVMLTPAQLGRAVGLDHAGEPTAMGLGWVHILPVNSADHIVEKTGGGAGFLTYIAINHAEGSALFLASTKGNVKEGIRGEAAEESGEHFNIFNAANKLLLAVSGLPPLPAKGDVPVVTAKTRVLTGKARLRRRRRA